MRRLPTLLFLSMLALPSVVMAQGEATAKDYPQLSGDASLGWISTSGNTDSSSANGEFKAELDYAVWRHQLDISGYRTAEDGMTTGERYAGSVQSDYKFSARSYLFVNANYARDHFGPYDRRAAITGGLGRRFIDTDTLTLALEAGAGQRMLEPAGTNERNREAIGRFHGNLKWAFSSSARFIQDVQVETGSSNTYTDSTSSLKSALVGALSLRISYEVQHNSDVPDGVRNTDTTTTVALDYGF